MNGPPDLPEVTDLIELLDARAAALPDLAAYTFLVDGERPVSWTFAELRRQAQDVADGLASRGILPGDRVLIAQEEGLEFLASLFGCMVLGAIAVPVHPPDPELPERTLPRVRAVVADCTPRAVLGQVDIELPEAAPPEPGLAYLQYTSGSTAAPKGVRIGHHHLLHQLRDFDHGYAHDGGCIVSWLPATHDLGLVYGRLMGLYRGIPTVFFSPAAFVQRPRRWLEALTRFGGTHSPSPNFGFGLAARRVKDTSGIDLSRVRVLLNGAEPIRREDEAAFVERFAAVGLRPQVLTHAMGMSEATAKIVTEPIGRVPRYLTVDPEALRDDRVELSSHGIEVASNGSTQFDTTIRIVDPERSVDLGEDRVGELWVHGGTVADGYWGRPGHPDFDGRLDGKRWLRTGDVGFLHDGELYLVGRLKDVLIVRGENHHAPDLERSVEAAHPAIRPNNTVAFSTPDETVAVVAEVRDGADPDEVFAAMRKALAGHGLAADALVLVSPRTIPKTTSGKLKRRQTRELWLAGQLAEVAHWVPHVTSGVGPVTDEASRLLGVPAEELDQDTVLRDLGLDSVTAVELVERVAARLGKPVSGTVLFDHPTLGALEALFADGAQDADDIDAMSEAEAEAALLAELEDL